MLYNPKWNDYLVVSRGGLIAWLLTKDPNERYIYTDYKNCLLRQYLRARGVSEAPSACRYAWGRLHRHLGDVALGSGRESWTFGAALKRAMQWSAK